MSESSTGLEPNLGGLLCYLLGVITGIAFLVLEQKDQDIRFHAYQSTATFGAILVANIAAAWLPVIGALITMLLWPVTLILWIVLMVKAYQGERFKLPVVGDWAEEQL